MPATDPIPMLARLDDSFLKSFQLSWDAINHDWRRNVVGFNFDRQRVAVARMEAQSCWRRGR